MAVLGDACGQLLHELGLHFHEVRGGPGRVGLGEVVPGRKAIVRWCSHACSRVQGYREKRFDAHTFIVRTSWLSAERMEG